MYVRKSWCKQTFLRCEQNFLICEISFINGFPCYCHSSYGAPSFCLKHTESLEKCPKSKQFIPQKIYLFFFSCFSCFFKLLLVGGRDLYLVAFVLFVSFFFFCRGKGYFNSLVGRVRDSSPAGQSMTYVSVLGAYNSFVGEWVDFGCN